MDQEMSGTRNTTMVLQEDTAVCLEVAENFTTSSRAFSTLLSSPTLFQLVLPCRQEGWRLISKLDFGEQAHSKLNQIPGQGGASRTSAGRGETA